MNQPHLDNTATAGTHLAVLLNVSLISTSFPIGAAITHGLEPAVLNFLRFALAAAVFALLLSLSRGWRRPQLKDWLRYLALACTLVGFFVAMFEALRLTTAINTAALFTFIPLISAAIAWPMLGQRTLPRQLVYMLLAGFGALLVVFKGSFANLQALRFGQGDLIFLAGCVSLAAFAPLTRKLDIGENLLSQTFWTLLVGSAMLASIGAVDLVAVDWQAVPSTVWSGIAYLAVFTTAATFYLVKYASLRMPAAKVMSYNYLVPSLVMLIEAIRTSEVPQPMLLVGAGITALAMLFLQFSPSPPTAR